MKAAALFLIVAILLIPRVGPAAEAPAVDAAKKTTATARARRLADGHPNWTGFWVPVGGLLEVNIGLGGTDGNSPSAARPFSSHPPLKSPYKEKFEQISADAIAGKLVDPLARCLPPGMPRMMWMIYGMELLQTPGQIAITSEFQAASRRIWLDRTTHPSADELDPTYTGDSVGHWEGDKLIVDTVGIREDVPMNQAGVPHSKNLRVREVFSEKTPGILEDQITMTDADAFVAPWVEIERYRIRPDLRIREYVCLENNRNVGPDGKATFD